MPKRKSSKFDIELGKRLREARLKRGFTRSEMAEMMDVCTLQYYKYEAGRTKLSAESLAMIMKFCEVPCSFFFAVRDEEVLEERDERIQSVGR